MGGLGNAWGRLPGCLTLGFFGLAAFASFTTFAGFLKLALALFFLAG